MTDQMLKSALWYAEQKGWAVFPLAPNSKLPIKDTHGHLMASRDPSIIRQWWANWPDANIGCFCKRSGLLVCDLDVKDGHDGPGEWARLKAECGFSDDGALENLTPSGGTHKVFSANGARISSSQSTLADGIDIKADTGYILLPPSKTPQGQYTWEASAHPADMTPAPLPPELETLLVSKRAEPFELPERIPSGNRNDTLFRLGCSYRSKEMNESEILAALQAVNTSRCDPPLGDGDLQTIAHSVARYERGTARLEHKSQEPETDQESQPGRPRTPRLLTRDYIGLFRQWGHNLRLNECNDDIEIDGEVLTDVLEHRILSRVRDHGITHRVGVNIQHAREAMTTQAAANAYHPVRDYLDDLTWDGDDHIGKLASYVTERPGSDKRFLRWFGCWIVGAVAKAYGRFQNPCLVLDGPQEIGKSYLVRWLCPLDRLFFAGAVFPDVKDYRLRQMDVWVWEIEELGSTTRRADLEALKAFLSTETIRDRKPYAHRDLIKPALASFIGTINADAGFLVDRTGNRRFLVCSIEKIDWAYADDLDVNQLWAQAVYLYRNTGDAWMLSEAERAERDAANEEFMVDDPVEAFLSELVVYTGSPTDMVTLPQLLNRLRENCTVSQRAQSMTISSVLKGWGATKRRTMVDGKQQQVYVGVKLI